MSELGNTTRGWIRRNLAWSNSRQSWEERIGLAVILAAGAALFLLRKELSVSAQSLLWALLVGLAALLFRRGWFKLFGPVLFYDLVRIARRSRYFIMRMLYILLLAVILGWVYLIWFLESRGTLQPRQLAVFAESFFYAFILIQLLMVSILTPAYTAGAIAEEKDRKTLEFLLATDLRNREIVLSKLMSRIANLTLLVLAGLPILSFLQFLGGVDPNLVLAGFAVTGVTLVGLASLSIFNSVVSKRPRDAIAMTYLTAVAYLALSGLSWFLLIPGAGINNLPSTESWTSPVTVEDLVYGFNAGNLIAFIVRVLIAVEKGGNLALILPDLVRNYLIFHALLAVVFIVWSVWRVRAIALKQAHGEVRKRTRRRGYYLKPRIGSLPMLWKEVYAEPGLRLNAFSRVVLVLLVVGSFTPAGLIFVYWHLDGPRATWKDLAEPMNVWVRVAGAVVACLLLLAIAGRAASSVSGERDRQTLEALLTSPLSSNSILFAKWVGNIVSIRWGWIWLSVIYFLGVVTQGLHPLALLLLTVAWFIYASVVSSIGMFFSVVCKTTLRATVWSLLMTVAAGVGHWFLWMCYVPFSFVIGREPAIFEVIRSFQVGLTPPVVLGYVFSFSDAEFNQYNRWQHVEWDLIAWALFGLCCWLAIAVVLWKMTTQRFRTIYGRVEVRRPERMPPRRQVPSTV